MDSPFYEYMRSFFTILYLYVLTPLSVMLESYILAAYSINMISTPSISPQRKFRRGVAVFAPFLGSLYAVLASEMYELNVKVYPFYVFLFVGLVSGYGFMLWASRVDESEEFFATLSCFVSSVIFFAIPTVFIISKSFEIINFVFGFLFGISTYVIIYGFSRAEIFMVRLSLARKLYNFVAQRIRERRSREEIVGEAPNDASSAHE